jgi:ArsR family transcriptional regulator
MQVETAAKLFGELGNKTRLDILRLLIKAGRDGLPIGDIHGRLDIPLSTLAFHLRGLVEAELIEQEKHGRSVLCRPRFDRINEAIAFLKEECCADVTHVGRRRPKVA